MTTESEPDELRGLSIEEAFLRYQTHDDVEALEQAWSSVRAPLYRRARRIAGHRQDPDELVQDTFVTALRIADRFRGGSLLAWLLEVLKFVALKHPNRPRESQCAVPIEDLPGTRSEPHSQLTAAETAGLIRAAIEELPEPYRSVIALRTYEEDSLQAVGERLGRSNSTVRTQWDRGLDKLRNKLPRSIAPLLLALLVVRTGRGASPSLPPTRSRARTHAGYGRILRVTSIAIVALVGSALIWSANADSRQTSPPDTPIPVAVAADRSSGTERVNRTPPLDLDITTAKELRVPAITIRARWSDSGAPATNVPLVLVAPLVPGVSGLRAHLDAMRTVSTDNRGVATFTDLPAGRCQLRLDDVRPVRDFRATAGRSLTLELDVPRPVVTVSGTVRAADGTPVEGATVHATVAERGLAPGYPAAITDASGAFVAGIPSRRGLIWATANDHAPSMRRSTMVSPRSTRVDLTLASPPSSIRGSVQQPDGTPADRAIVGIYPHRLDAPPAFVRTDERGHFDAQGLRVGEHLVVAVLPGIGFGERRCTLPSQSPIVVPMREGCTVHGVVHGVARDQVAGMRVCVRRLVEHSGPADALLYPATTLQTDSTFALPACPTGPAIFGALDASHGTLHAKVHHEVPSAGETFVSIVPSDTPHVIRIVDSDGYGVRDLVVRVVEDRRAPPRTTHMKTRSGPDGTTRITTPPANRATRIEVYVSPESEFPILAAPVSKQLRLVDTAEHAVTGRIAGPNLDRILVRLLQVDGSCLATENVDPHTGSWSFPRVPRGTYELGLSEDIPIPFYSPLRRIEVGDDPVEVDDIRITGLGRLQLRTANAKGPVAFSLAPGSGMVSERNAVWPREDWVRTVSAGDWVVHYPDTDGTPRTIPVTIRPAETTDIELPRGPAVACKLRFEMGRHLQARNDYVNVKIRSLRTGGVLRCATRLVTQRSEGFAEVTVDLAVGDYWVHAKSRDFGRFEGRLSVHGAVTKTFPMQPW